MAEIVSKDINRIKKDHRRFKQIVRGKIKRNLRKYMSHGELTGKQGKDLVKIPLPQIDIPRFRFASEQQGGASQGDGQPGGKARAKGANPPSPAKAGRGGRCDSDVGQLGHRRGGCQQGGIGLCNRDKGDIQLCDPRPEGGVCFQCGFNLCTQGIVRLSIQKGGQVFIGKGTHFRHLTSTCASAMSVFSRLRAAARRLMTVPTGVSKTSAASL